MAGREFHALLRKAGLENPRYTEKKRKWESVKRRFKKSPHSLRHTDAGVSREFGHVTGAAQLGITVKVFHERYDDVLPEDLEHIAGSLAAGIT